MKQRCILVLGMHRSGTSAIAGVLSLLDVFIGTDLMNANEANLKGYFENNAFYNLNKLILSELNCSWHDLFYKLNIVKESSKYKYFVNLIKNEIVGQFNYSKIFAIKDPRIIYLMPVYEQALNELKIELNIIIPYRNPLEVAFSLKTRDQFTLEKGMLLWLYNLLYAEIGSRKYKRVFFNFDDLLSNTKKIINDISSSFDLGLDEKYSDAENFIDDFLTKDLKHHNIPENNFSENMPRIIREFYELLEKNNSTDQNPEFEKINQKFIGLQKLFYCDEIVSDIKRLPVVAEKLKERETELAETRKKLSDRETELAETQKKLDDISINLQKMIDNAKVLNNKIEHINKKTNKTQNENENLKDELTLIYSSRSWRYTRILRRVNRFFYAKNN